VFFIALQISTCVCEQFLVIFQLMMPVPHPLLETIKEEGQILATCYVDLA
jgi:hypothetical protein